MHMTATTSLTRSSKLDLETLTLVVLSLTIHRRIPQRLHLVTRKDYAHDDYLVDTIVETCSWDA